MTLACEYLDSKLVDLVCFVDVDVEGRVDDSLVKILTLNFDVS